jgi:hypothetical protein
MADLDGDLYHLGQDDPRIRRIWREAEYSGH